MFRRLLTLILLVPLSLNGLWVVCAEAGTPESTPTTEPQKAAGDESSEPVCAGAAMCPLHKAAAEHAETEATPDDAQDQLTAQYHVEQTGAMCLIFSPDGKSTSIAAIGFVYAPPAATVNLGTPQTIVLEVAETASSAYLDALSPGETPPPRA